MRERLRRRVKRHAVKKDLVFLTLFTLVYTSSVLLSGRDLVERSRQAGGQLALHPAGLALLGLGLVLVFVSFFTLGRNYSSFVVIHHDHRLVTRGIYSRVRHPIYLGVIVATVGIAWCGTSVLGLLGASLLVPLFVFRMRYEEALLVEEFGDDYRRYAKRTHRLLPGVY